MRLFFYPLLLIFIITSCSKNEGNMIVQGQIKGLKKGTLYLQKVKDTALITIDSVAVLGDDTFRLSDNVDAPEVYYLTFDGNTTNRSILFFGEKGTITINDKVSEYGFNPEIRGSKNQELLTQFSRVRGKFNQQQLEFVKKDFDARKENDTALIAQLDKEYEKVIRRRYLYITNFAVNNANNVVAPYVALTELYNANIKLLDTVNNSLSSEVKNSLYGKKLQAFIDQIKVEEN